MEAPVTELSTIAVNSDPSICNTKDNSHLLAQTAAHAVKFLLMVCRM